MLTGFRGGLCQVRVRCVVGRLGASHRDQGTQRLMKIPSGGTDPTAGLWGGSGSSVAQFQSPANRPLGLINPLCDLPVKGGR